MDSICSFEGVQMRCGSWAHTNMLKQHESGVTDQLFQEEPSVSTKMQQ